MSNKNEALDALDEIERWNPSLEQFNFDFSEEISAIRAELEKPSFDEILKMVEELSDEEHKKVSEYQARNGGKHPAVIEAYRNAYRRVIKKMNEMKGEL